MSRMGFAKKIPLNMAPKLAGNSTILFRGAEATLLNPLPPPPLPPPWVPTTNRSRGSAGMHRAVQLHLSN